MTLFVKLAAAAAASATLFALAPEPAEAQRGAGGWRGARTNADGGVTAGRGWAARGPDGGYARAGGFRGDGQGGGAAGRWGSGYGPNGGFARGAGVNGDGQGNFFGGSGGCAAGYQGAACRRGRFEGTEDGGFSRYGQGGFEGANGAWGRTESDFRYNPDGTFYGGRNTEAYGESGSYNARTDYNQDYYSRDAEYIGEQGSRIVDSFWERGQGGSRTVTCFDPDGFVVACPSY